MNNFDWREEVTLALQHYHDLEALRESPLGNLHLARQLLNSLSVEHLYEHRRGIAVQRLLDRGIEELGRFDSASASLLLKRFAEHKSVRALQVEMHFGKTVLYERLKQAVDALVSLLIRLEAEVVEQLTAEKDVLISQLPPPTYQRWIGDYEELANVRRLLDEGQRRRIKTPLFVTGIGGLGKTSLLREAIVTWLESTSYHIDQVLWTVIVQPLVSLDTQLQRPRRRYTLEHVLTDLGAQLGVQVNTLPSNERKLQMLAQVLQNTATLLVIDNVETPEEAAMALSVVGALSHVSHVLMTTRYQIKHPNGNTLVVRELSAEHASLLLRSEAERLELEAIDEATLARIYRTLGGHPHALKLAIAQLRHLPAEQVLQGFEEHSATAQALFFYIYETAWSLLSPLAQDVLLGLWLLPPAGAGWEELRMTLQMGAGLDSTQGLEESIRELTALNLVQTTQTQPIVYSLHRLTYNYLSHKMGLLEGESTA